MQSQEVVSQESDVTSGSDGGCNKRNCGDAKRGHGSSQPLRCFVINENKNEFVVYTLLINYLVLSLNIPFTKSLTINTTVNSNFCYI